MSETEPIDSAFTSVEAEQLPEPRAISGLAVIALVLGLFSAGALASPLMWFLPVAGLVIAVAALGSIAKDPVGKLGRGAALLGMMLSLLFASWGVSNYLTRQRLIYRQAEVLAHQWLRMVLEDKLQEAHQLTIPQSDRCSPEIDLAEYYEADAEAKADYAELWEQQALSELIDLGPDAVCRFVRDEQLTVERDLGTRTEMVTQRFEIEYEQNGRTERMAVDMVMARERDRRSGEARWRVAAVDPVYDRQR